MNSTLLANAQSLISQLNSNNSSDIIEKLNSIIFSFATIPPSSFAPNKQEFEVASKFNKMNIIIYNNTSLLSCLL